MANIFQVENILAAVWRTDWKREAGGKKPVWKVEIDGVYGTQLLIMFSVCVFEVAWGSEKNIGF